jgi:acylglycerol lipase
MTMMMPAPTSEETTVAADGTALHVERFMPGGAPRAVVVIVHGFSAHCGNYRHVASDCAGAGLATTLFDCRGHGQSQGRRGYVDRFSSFVADLDLILGGARALSPGLPVGLVGHSHGAAICLDYLLGGGGGSASVNALAMVAPFLALKLKVPAAKLAASKVLGRIWPTFTQGNEIRGEDISRTPEVVAGFDTDPLIHHVASSRWFNEVRSAQARITGAAARLTTPTLMLVAGQDRIVDTEVALAFARAAGPVVEVKRYDNLFHEMFLEPERDQVIADLVRWLSLRLSPTVGP